MRYREQPVDHVVATSDLVGDGLDGIPYHLELLRTKEPAIQNQNDSSVHLASLGESLKVTHVGSDKDAVFEKSQVEHLPIVASQASAITQMYGVELIIVAKAQCNPWGEVLVEEKLNSL